MMDSPRRKHYLMQAFRRNWLEQNLSGLLIDVAKELAAGFPGDQDSGERGGIAWPAAVITVELVEHVQARAFAQAQVGNDDIGWLHPLVHRLHRLLRVFGGHHLAAPAAQQVADAREDARLLVEH